MNQRCTATRAGEYVDQAHTTAHEQAENHEQLRQRAGLAGQGKACGQQQDPALVTRAGHAVGQRARQQRPRSNTAKPSRQTASPPRNGPHRTGVWMLLKKRQRNKLHRKARASRPWPPPQPSSPEQLHGSGLERGQQGL